MELQKQVSSLELSKKLKELGVPQDSLFWWSECVNYDFDKTGDWEILQDVNCDGVISAFTVAELGEMLQSPISCKGFNSCIIKSFKIDDIYVSAVYNLDGKHIIWIEADTEADARAKMLIYLLENKLITL